MFQKSVQCGVYINIFKYVEKSGKGTKEKEDYSNRK